MSKIRVLIVDDHALVRLGLMTLINDQADMQVVGEASAIAEALKLIESIHPQVVLMDIRMPGGSGIEATQQIVARFPDTKVIILTSFADDELIMRSLQAGAVGYVLKEADNDELLRAIAAAARGEALLDPVVTARLISKMRSLGRQADEDAFHSFTQREMTILAELSLGKTNAEIAHALNLSEKTVRNQVSTMLDKLNLSNRVELATYAVEHHIYDRVAKS